MLPFANIIPYSKRLGSQANTTHIYETLPWSSWSNLGTPKHPAIAAYGYATIAGTLGCIIPLEYSSNSATGYDNRALMMMMMNDNN